ncbi:MAG TPA: CDP-diacylglycerol--glycerol-3-phosphate 3-phosphatidyltransferase [Candidatus Ornithospirochaeta avicola]|uniref:CDP-diacylglycerol--glycerol-3-phosphate 3-phosphatidyltransferase n=1 Tax=Candidatus Ornithospirochaeta avicola TaxID=2840896 RepID=A0A9D1TNI2_9SPIO|nr:CDP-diacylglycerol--glycerol-3-phosphate 3-phosphatidyltransferase [Candidatus Ornithospirochaeta avicola]
MNIPNRLTVLRLVLVPVFFIAFSLPSWFGSSVEILSAVLVLICYATAELSDLIDGKIARKYNLVTDLGKVMDPFADTLSHLTFFVCFLSRGIMPAWTFVIIMWREFAILFMRMLLIKQGGKAMPANIWGKSKTCLYAFTSIISILYIVVSAFADLSSADQVLRNILYVFFSLSALAALLSFVTYLSDVIKSKALSGMTR